MTKDYSQVEERILTAAEQLFAEHGFRGTSLRDITAAAGCNIAAVNYHFHGKEKLYIAVFQRHMKAATTTRFTWLQEASAHNSTTLSLEAVLRAFADSFILPFFNSQQGQLTSKLILQEEQDPHLPKQMFFDEVVTPLREIIRHPVMRRCPYLTVEQANQCIHSLVAQLLYTLHAQVIFTGVDETMMPVLNIEKTLTHIVQFTARGMTIYDKPIT